MDVLAHSLWSGIITFFANLKLKKKMKVFWAIFWGIFPDLFSFTLLFIWIGFSLITGSYSPVDLQKVDAYEPVGMNAGTLFNLTNVLYKLSHSLIIFACVFLLVWGIKVLLYKKFNKTDGLIPLVMLFWLLHISIDIFTHSYEYYPTPFLWPISDFMFNGISWVNTTFMIINYTLIIIIYGYIYYLFRRKSKKKNKHEWRDY